MKRIACLLLIIVMVGGCGVLAPYTRKRQNIQEADLSWYSILYSLSIEDEQPEIKQRWNEYWKKLEEYKKRHPEVKQETLAKMKYCDVILGMSEEQVLLMAEPQSILKGANPNEKIFAYSAKSERPDTGSKVWITITDGVVTKIDDEVTAYGW